MSAVTYHGGYAPTAEATAKPARKGLFARILDAMMEARMRQAASLVERNLGYMPEETRERYRRAVRNAQQELPFGR